MALHMLTLEAMLSFTSQFMPRPLCKLFRPASVDLTLSSGSSIHRTSPTPTNRDDDYVLYHCSEDAIIDSVGENHATDYSVGDDT